MTEYEIILRINKWGLLLSEASKRSVRAECTGNATSAARYEKIGLYCAKRMGIASGYAQRKLILIEELK